MDIIITPAESGKSIYTLTRQDMGFSSAMLKKLKFSEGGILVNGEFVTVRYILKEGDVLSLALEDTAEDVSPYIIPVEMELPVLYEDEALTVINKPPDMIFSEDYASLLHAEPIVSYWLDILCMGDDREKQELFMNGRKEVDKVADRIRAGKERILERYRTSA